MIPRLLHHIWLGPRPVPDEWLDAWRALNPGWEQRLWREGDLAKLRMTNRRQYRQLLKCECWHGAADIARLEVLREQGGLYVDIDSKPLRSLDGAPFLDANVFAAYEPTPSLPGRVANGTIGAQPDAPVIKTALALIRQMPDLSEPWDTTGGTALTAALLVHRRCCDVRVLPARTFYPQDAHGRPVAGRETPFCEHFWSTTNRTYPPTSVVLVPRRAGDPIRDRAWDFVHEWWTSHGWRVVEGHHDDGLFNASLARNRAAKLAGEWDVAIFADADTVPGDAALIREAVSLAKERRHLVRPYRRYYQLDEDASERWLREGGPKPQGPMRMLGEVAHGGVNIVSRDLFDAVRGYDQRFVGWGWEDTSFEAACRAMGGFTQLPGEVYHLWHPHQPRDPSTDEYRANVALGKRYISVGTNRRRMQQLLDERVPSAPARRETFGLVVVSNGRGELLQQTMDGIARHVGKLDMTLICDDSGDVGYFHWMRERWPEARYDAHKHLGHGPAIRRAWHFASRLDVDWLLWMEEDMVFQRDIDLPTVAKVVRESGVAQMVFKRNSHFPAEVAAGPTMIDRFAPSDFRDCETGGHRWLEHRLFYSLNPHLVRRSFLRSHNWPPVPNSEHHFGLRLFKDRSVRVGLWEARDAPPIVLHAGTERTGSGY